MFPTCSLRDAFDFCLYSSQAPISRDCKVHIFFSFFFWLERLAKPTDKVTRSHQERGFQSSEQTCSALQTPYKTTWVLELIHPTDPRSCHPINTPRVCINQAAQRRFSFHFSRSVMMDDVQWHFWINNKELVVFSHSYETKFHGTFRTSSSTGLSRSSVFLKGLLQPYYKDNLTTRERVKHQAIWFQNPETEYQRIINYGNPKALILMNWWDRLGERENTDLRGSQTSELFEWSESKLTQAFSGLDTEPSPPTSLTSTHPTPKSLNAPVPALLLWLLIRTELSPPQLAAWSRSGLPAGACKLAAGWSQLLPSRQNRPFHGRETDGLTAGDRWFDKTFTKFLFPVFAFEVQL